MKREYPARPIVGVGGVVVDRGRVLLIRRGREPMKGEWSIPGGVVELGESLGAAVRRELREETGLEIQPVAVLEVFDRIVRRKGRVRYHYVIVDYACRKRGGRLRPASDVREARWVRPQDLPRYRLSPKALRVIEEGRAFFHKARPRRAGPVINKKPLALRRPQRPGAGY